MTNFRDVEKLSAYLDGHLSPAESTRIESRLESDPELAAVFDELRKTRSMLRQLPQRRVPRNFTLTPKMVGRNPPLPRAYPFFRLAGVVATLLFFITFALNAISPAASRVATQSAPGFNFGGAAAEPEMALEAPAEAVEEPAPLPMATALPAQPAAPAEPPSVGESVLPTPTFTGEGAADNASPEETLDEQQKAMEPERGVSTPDVSIIPSTGRNGRPPEPKRISPGWQIVLAILALTMGLSLLFMRIYSTRKWQREK